MTAATALVRQVERYRQMTGEQRLAVALDLPHVQIFSQPRAWRAGPQGCSHLQQYIEMQTL